MGKYETISGLRSMWSMSKYRDRTVYDTWQIWRQDRVPGKDGKYWIEKLERNIQAPEDPERSVVPLTVGEQLHRHRQPKDVPEERALRVEDQKRRQRLCRQ